MIDTIGFVAICLLISFFLSELFHYFKYPRVLGYILAGIFLGLPVFSGFFSGEILSDIGFLSELGIIFLLMLTGMEINFRNVEKTEKDSTIIALFSIITSFAMGFLLIYISGFSLLSAFVVGACFALTAEGTIVELLFENKVLNTKLGTIIVSSGIIDDLFGVTFLSVILLIVTKNLPALALFPFKLLIFIAIAYLAYRLLPAFLRFIHDEKSMTTTFSALILFALIIAALSDNLSLGPIIGAFLAGLIIQISMRNKRDRKDFKENKSVLELMTLAFIVPFFFINIGLNFDIVSVIENWPLVIIITLVATISKIVGSIIATPFTSLNIKQTHLIGWGRNSRGGIELVIAEVARLNGLISIEIYSAFVAMAVITTFVFPIILRSTIKGDRTIMY